MRFKRHVGAVCMVNPDGGVPKCTDFLREFFLALFTVIVSYVIRVHQGEAVEKQKVQINHKGLQGNSCGRVGC